MTKREAKFGTLFSHWLRANKKSISTSAFEYKQTTTNALAFSAVKEHQVDALLACKSDEGFYFKIPDTSFCLLPFDGFFIRNGYAYVIIKYPKAFYLIDIDDFVSENKNSKRRSLTSERASEIAIWSVPLAK